MKILISLICLILITSNSFAQKKKASTKSQKPSVSFLAKPFDETLKKLPVNFVGHNLTQIILRLAAIDLVKKSEFETREEYKDRVNKLYNKPLYGTLTMFDTVAFSFHPETKYNADTENLFIMPEQADDGIVWSSYLDNKGSYIGQNGFGVKVKINKRDLFQYFIDSNIQLNSFNLKVPRKDAIETKFGFYGLVVGEIDFPYVENFSTPVTPTLDFPYEGRIYTFKLKLKVKQIWWFNALTGEVYLKQNFT